MKGDTVGAVSIVFSKNRPITSLVPFSYTFYKCFHRCAIYGSKAKLNWWELWMSTQSRCTNFSLIRTVILFVITIYLVHYFLNIHQHMSKYFWIYFHKKMSVWLMVCHRFHQIYRYRKLFQTAVVPCVRVYVCERAH